jgi:RNA polymerase sigma-70 factor (ECF subfamily)
VDDVVQEVFLHVHRSLPRFRGDARFTTWLYRLTANITKMHLRKRASRPRVVDVEVPDLPRHVDPPEAPDDALARQLRVRALYRLLEQLSEKKRTVLVLHDLEGMPAAEIADVVEAPIMTVRTRLFYARRDLYAMFEQEPTLAAVLQDLGGSLRGQGPGGDDGVEGGS